MINIPFGPYAPHSVPAFSADLPCMHQSAVRHASKLAKVKSQKLLPKYIEKDAKQGPSSQFAERDGSGL